MKISQEVSQELRWSGVSGAFKRVEIQIEDHSRWSITKRLVFKDAEGKLWAFYFDIGATECQEVDEPEEYECLPVSVVMTETYKVDL